MQWFKHDTGALQDAKLKKLIIKYGVTGYAVYFHCLELIAGNVSETNLTFELEHDCEIIADDLHIKDTEDQSGQAIVEEVMQYIISLGLFEESQGHIFCLKMLKRLDGSMSSNPQFRKLILEAKNSHDEVIAESCQNHDEIMTESCQHHDGIMMNPDKVMLDKNRIDKIRKEKNILSSSQATKPSATPPVLDDSQDCLDGSESDPEPQTGDRTPTQEAIDHNSQEFKMATLLYDLHRELVDQKFSVSDARLEAWAKDIERLQRIDGRSWEEIERVLKWAKHDSFWGANIISGKKFREKYPTLVAQMNRNTASVRPSGLSPPKVFSRTELLDMEEG